MFCNYLQYINAKCEVGGDDFDVFVVTRIRAKLGDAAALIANF